ncbi:PHP domain-containing protein [Cellulomonas carbonis]|uniref:Histidinol phosphatase n=1 Tax=Cellulomonas carbonis T26 TaxID=947969 RepID=A0A0A0BQW8_9CELL|nr:PHP domain-containing protein [Cellulomonas carbonis]KGM10863.1 histidinol phosphatase [Cellulomonas carbonis T26]GGB92512.1 PHP domain-containing protein [Cellulomonas carbonis]
MPHDVPDPGVPTDGSPGRDDVVRALHRIAFLLERRQESQYRSRAYRAAGDTLRALDDDAWAAHARDGRWQDLPGVGERTAGVIAAVLDGEQPRVLADLEADLTERNRAATPEGQALRDLLRGDLHAHTEASDGSASLTDMALAAIEVGHEYQAITDHSPRLTVANGLSAERLRGQVRRVAALNRSLEDAARATGRPFRVLTGIEVDVLDDGTLDQEPALLAELDVVVASVHSKLRMDRAAMTRRMVAAVRGPATDVLGHCTGRRVLGRERPQSEFDAEAVFAACAEAGVAVEVNSRPDRRDPPHALIDVAVAAGCLFSIDSDAHAPGQLDWLVDGCDRLAAHGVDPDRVVTTWPVERLLEWTHRH